MFDAIKENYRKFRKLKKWEQLFISAMVVMITLYGGSKHIVNIASDPELSVTSADLTYDENSDETLLTIEAEGSFDENLHIWWRASVTNQWTQVHPVAYSGGTFTLEGDYEHEYTGKFWYFGDDLPPVIIENDEGIIITSFIVTGRGIHLEWDISDERLANANFVINYHERAPGQTHGSLSQWLPLGDPTTEHSFDYHGFTLDRYREYRVTAEVGMDN